VSAWSTRWWNTRVSSESHSVSRDEDPISIDRDAVSALPLASARSTKGVADGAYDARDSPRTLIDYDRYVCVYGNSTDINRQHVRDVP